MTGWGIEVFKILNGYENIDSNIFFEIKESETSFKLVSIITIIHNVINNKVFLYMPYSF